MALTVEQVSACNERLNAAGDRLLDVEGLLRERHPAGPLEPVDSLMLKALGDILSVVTEIVNLQAPPS